MRVSSLLKSNSTLNPPPFPPNPTLFKSINYLHHQTQPPPPPPPPPPNLTPTHLNALLNAAHETKNINHATQLHAQIITHNFISLPFLFNNLLNLYSKCGRLSQTLTLFSTSHRQSNTNVVTWTSIITQLSRSNKPFQALEIFKKMRRSGLLPNHFTFSTVLPACAGTEIAVHGEQIHSLVWKSGFELNVFVGSGLVDMYAKCGNMMLAQKVFDEMPERNLVTWNCMIVGFLQNNLYDRAVGCFNEVIREGLVCPNEVSISSVLSACACMVDVDIGRQVHGVVVKHGLVCLAYVRNSLMDMYSKCGFFEDCVELFRTVQERDVVTWNVMVMGCIHNNKFEEACNYFWTMRHEGLPPDEVSLSSALHAAASIAALDQGTLIHNQIVKTGFETNMCVARSLITMYSKCGKLADGYRLFNESENRDVLHWTTMISACQQHGFVEQALELFEDMLAEGITPGYITYISVLSACSHTGCVDKGFSYFNLMSESHNINPGPEHYACMVDLLGRAGRLCEAKDFVESMPIVPNASVWGALLAACSNYGNLEMGREVAKRLIEIQPDNSGNYVLLYNMYVQCGMSKEAKDVRRLMAVKRVRKAIGCSWIDYKNKAFVFTANDMSNSRSNEIYELLETFEELVKKKGNVTQNHSAVYNLEQDTDQLLVA